MATAVDLPMYVGFILLDGQYSIVAYSFHKLECACLFSAYSITISDWSSVLLEIREDEYFYNIRYYILIFVNLVIWLVSLANFVLCLTDKDKNLDAYTSSPIYYVGLVVQMTSSLILTCVMLHAGLKLYWRIKGVAGGGAVLSHSQTTPNRGYNPANRQKAQGVGGSSVISTQSAEFQSALVCLIAVMATCTICEIIQVVDRECYCCVVCVFLIVCTLIPQSLIVVVVVVVVLLFFLSIPLLSSTTLIFIRRLLLFCHFYSRFYYQP